jgi:hypothetical protein
MLKALGVVWQGVNIVRLVFILLHITYMSTEPSRQGSSSSMAQPSEIMTETNKLHKGNRQQLEIDS